LGVASRLLAMHPVEFYDKVKELQSIRGRRYFVSEPDQLQEARQIGSSGIWVETCFSANAVRDRSYELLAAFGLTPDKLTVELLPKKV
jgi:hypothetical protein